MSFMLQENVPHSLVNSDHLNSTTVRRNLVEHGSREIVNGENVYENGVSMIPMMIATQVKRHDDEQSELQDLNLKLTDYLLHVQRLESYNGQLLAELETIKEHWGIDSEKLHRTNTTQLSLLRDGIDKSLRDKIFQELETLRYEIDKEEVQQRIAVIDDGIGDRLKRTQQDLNRSIKNLERIKFCCNRRAEDVEKGRKIVENLHNEFDALQLELRNHRLDRSMVENELQTLREHIAFEKATHLVQRNEVLSLGESAVNPSDFYHDELIYVIDDIRHDFEARAKSQIAELEEYYRIKTDEIKNKARQSDNQGLTISQLTTSEEDANSEELSDMIDDIKQLKLENQQLEIEVEEILNDLERIQDEHNRENEKLKLGLARVQQEISDKRIVIDNILDGNISLHSEIATYRSLLNSEEKRRSRANETNSDDILADSVQNQHDSNKDAKPNVPEKMAVKKVSRGTVLFNLIDFVNDYVVIQHEKYSGSEQSLGKWTMHHKVDQEEEKVFHFPQSFSIKPRQKVAILSKKSSVPTSQDYYVLVADNIDTWRFGQTTVTTLNDENNEEKAQITHSILF